MTERSPYKFDWGETVRVSQNAPERFRPSQLSSVCGFRLIETAEQSVAFGAPIGTVLCLIEFGDGSSVEIPEPLLEKWNPE
jgi:hypothetical protein